jgi:hypothetical protein
LKRRLYPLLAIIAIGVIAFSMTLKPAAAQTIPPSGTYVHFYVNPQPPSFIAGIDPVGEYIYRVADNTAPYQVAVGDTRVTPINNGQYAANSVVQAGDADIGKNVINFKTGTTAPREKHTENVAADGNMNYGEYIYRDADSSGTVSDGDVRYTNVGSYTAGTKVSLANGDTDIGMALINFHSTTAPYERHVDNIVVPGVSPTAVYDYAKIWVDIYVDCDLVDADPGSMAGWQINIQTNTAVITPTAESYGAAAGFFLFDFKTNQGLSETPSLVSAALTGGILKLAEQIVPTPSIGAGNVTLEPGGYKLVTAMFAAQSLTAYSRIDLQFIDTLIGGDPLAPGSDGVSDDWMTTEGYWYPATVYDGNYNQPAVPEFPLGIAPIIMLAPAIPIVYLWRTRRKVIKK